MTCDFITYRLKNCDGIVRWQLSTFPWIFFYRYYKLTPTVWIQMAKGHRQEFCDTYDTPTQLLNAGYMMTKHQGSIWLQIKWLFWYDNYDSSAEMSCLCLKARWEVGEGG